MSETLSGSRSRQTCRRCDRTVQMVPVGGELVACELEVAAFVPSGRYGETVPVRASVTGRRVHAELCEGYQLAAERDRNRKKMAAFSRRQNKKGL